MKAYGLDENISFPDPSMSWEGCEDGIHHEGNGIVIEWRAFPSMLHRGLEFSLARTYFEATDENMSFAWYVSDGLAPVNAFGSIKIFDSGVGPEIQAIILQAGRQKEHFLWLLRLMPQQKFLLVLLTTELFL